MTDHQWTLFIVDLVSSGKLRIPFQKEVAVTVSKRETRFVIGLSRVSEGTTRPTAGTSAVA